MSTELTPNQELWVQALESDEYGQGQGQLADGQGHFCCLGVACEAAIKAGVPLKVTKDNHGRAYDFEEAVLPVAVVKWLGLSEASTNPYIGSCLAIELNDDHKLPFPEIAALIRKHGIK